MGIAEQLAQIKADEALHKGIQQGLEQGLERGRAEEREKSSAVFTQGDP